MSNPILRVDTSFLATSTTNEYVGDAPPTPTTPTTPSGQSRARSLSQAVLPTFRLASGSNAGGPSSSLTSNAVSQGPNKARNESRKLLAHLLSQLKSRPMPPPLMQVLIHGPSQQPQNRFKAQSPRGAVKHRRGMRSEGGAIHRTLSQEDTDNEWEENSEFNTDVTFDLMTQLKDVLLISVAQKWDLFSDSSFDSDLAGESGKSSHHLRPGRNVRGLGRRSRSRSRTQSESMLFSEPEGASHLLSQCISILLSVITEDCRYRISSPRPSRPPHALQSVTLDVAQFLLHSHRHDPQILSHISSAIVPAFYTFRPIMHTRLLAFFDDGVIGNILDDLKRIQGTVDTKSQSTDIFYGDASPIKPPMFSILVDEVADVSEPAPHDSNWRRWSTPNKPFTNSTRSTNAPSQDVAVYQLSSVIPSLLAAMLENVDLNSLTLSTLHRFHRLIRRIVETKPDAYSDVLSVIAYHTARARYFAVGLLMTYWPRAVGHLVSSKALPVLNYSASLVRANEDPAHARRQPHDHTHSHQFVPWRFGPRNMPALFEGVSLDQCRSCSKDITGFCLLCPFCMCAVHFDCYDYPEGSFHTQYTSASDTDIQKIAVFRFSHIIPHRRQPQPMSICKEQHAFRPVNLFTLALCSICRQPLWGCVMQALKCRACRQFVHPSCLENASEDDLPRCRSVAMDDSYMTIPWSELRTSFLFHFGELIFTEADLNRRTYEEVSVFYTILWSQLQILDNGIALGSIVVLNGDSDDADDSDLEEFELHIAVSLYDAYLSSGKLLPSETLAEQLFENNLRAPDTRIFFSWSTLTFIASIIKMPASSNMVASSSSALLSVAQPDSFNGTGDDDSSYPYEVVPLSHIRDQLGDQLQLHSEAAARHSLTLLSHFGFFQPLNPCHSLFDDVQNPERQPCYFPLPVGIEVSTDVETLVSAIEACLSDLDLSVNEVGLLLLVRRFWPDGLLTDYALRRLAKALLEWTWSEDNHLAVMLRDFVARGRSLPGVRPAAEGQSWPTSVQARPVPSSSTNNGGDYIVARRDLLNKYVTRWMMAFHDRDIDAYAVTVFDLIVGLAEDGLHTDDYFLGKTDDDAQAKRQHSVADKTLRLILKLCQASLVFTAFDSIFRLWLERANELSLDLQPMQSLARLFNREVEATQRFSSVVDSRVTISDANNLATVNALRVLIDAATGSREGFEQTLHWLCLFVRSGVDISVATFTQFTSVSKRFNATLDESMLLIQAALWATWQKSMGRQELQEMVANIHSGVSFEIIDALRSRIDLEKILSFIRQSLAICLLLYGCERGYIVGLGMIREKEIAGLPSRRKSHTRHTTVTDPIIVSSQLMEALKSYVATEIEEVSCLAGKFLNAFVNDAAFVESYEVDNFILRNGSTLCTCVWQFYDIQLPEISNLRTSLLLRMLSVDPQPFQALLHGLFEANGGWDVRMHSVLRLFRVILDVTSPAFNVEDRQWRSSIIDVFYYFFSCLWADDREEIRLAVDTWCDTLLPGHFEAIALCWNEALSKSPISERVRLVSFLTQLRSHFPSWRVLSWTCMIETLVENDFDRKNGDDEDGPAAAHLSMYGFSSKKSSDQAEDAADPDLDLLQVSLLSLCLRMISDGIQIDTLSLLKIKDQVVRTLGFQDVSLVPAPSGQSFYVRFSDLDEIPESATTCLSDLMDVLDSSQAYDVAPFNMGGRFVDEETTSKLLVGSVFVDVILDIFIHAEKIASLPFVTLKNLLKSLIVVIYKHDFETLPLRYLQGNLRRAVRRTLDVLLMNLSYELRQLALSACQAFIRRWPTIIGNLICDAIESAAQLMVDLGYEHNGEDVLVDQTRMFLDSTLTLYASSGVFFVLCKRHLPTSFFEVIRYIAAANVRHNKNPNLHENLRDILLRDTLARFVENDPDAYQTVVENINAFVETVHHIGYSADLMQFVGLSLTHIARRTADWPADAFDPSPLLLLACTLVQHNKAHSRDLLMFMETLLRAALVRFHVSGESLARVIHVTSTLYRRAAAATAPGTEAPQTNPLALAIFEIMSEGLRGRARVSSATVSGLAEAVGSVLTQPGRATILSDEWLVHLADDGLFYLYSDSGQDGVVQSDFSSSQTVANFVLQASEIYPGILGRLTKNSAVVQTWNALAIAALGNKNPVQCALLFDQFPLFSHAYSLSLQPYQGLRSPIELDPQSSAHADLSHAYAALKLWLMLAQRSSLRQRELAEKRVDYRDNDADILRSAEVFAVRMVWNEMWPPFESVVTAFEADAHAGHVSPLASTVWASVADLILFLRQSRCVALEESAMGRILDRLHRLLRGGRKLSRVMRSMTEPPPDVPMEFFVNQVKTEVQAEEKLQAAKRQDSGQEKGRRIVS